MDIEDWRIEINEIDEEIIRLLNRRARLATKVGVLKMKAGIAICDPERERVVISRVIAVNTGPLDECAVGKIFRRIIRESRRVETRDLTQQESQTNEIL